MLHVELGRAYTVAGDVEAARASYEHFLDLWKGADPDVPLLLEARAELAALGPASGS